MFQEQSFDHDVEPELSEIYCEIEDLRSILARSGRLPAAVVAADISRIDDRVLDNEIRAVLSNPENCLHDDAINRCELRGRALKPYVGRRLICVSINLPGVRYTIEVDPVLRTVIHCEFVTD